MVSGTIPSNCPARAFEFALVEHEAEDFTDARDFFS